MLDAEITRANPNLVVAYWGTLPLGEIAALRSRHPGIKIALVMLCYPLGLSDWEVARQHLALRRAARSIDALVCPTIEMVEYLRRNVLGEGAPPCHVIEPCWPESFLAQTRPSAAMDAPNLVFIGRTDLRSKNIQKSDDVRHAMQGIIGAGIHLYHAASGSSYPPHSYRHEFATMDIRSLISHIASYDASVLIYNLAVCRRTERFDLTVPDRLISSVAAGVPIAVPAKGYSASKSYLRAYGALLEFSDWGDLSRKLSDRARVASAKEMAWQNRSHYTAEARGKDYQALVSALQ